MPLELPAEHALQPRPIAQLQIELNGQTAQALTDAEFAIRQLTPLSPDCLRSKAFRDERLTLEAVACSKVSGRKESARALIRLRHLHGKANEADRRDMLRNEESLACAIRLGSGHTTAKTFRDIHRCLLEETTREEFRGLLRADAFPAGGSRYHAFGTPRSAAAPEKIPSLLDDLAVFLNRTDIPAVAQAAIALAQFAAIQPFARANGRTARAILQLVFSRRKLLDGTAFPISLHMALTPHDFYRGMTATINNLTLPEPDQRELNAWFKYFSECCQVSSSKVREFETNADALVNGWISRLGARSDSVSNLVLMALPGMPVFTAASAAEYVDRSFKRVSSCIDELVELGAIRQITKGKRNRVFESPAIMDAYTSIPGFQ